MIKWKHAVLVLVTCLVCAATPAFARNDRVSFANDITIEEGSMSGDLVCILCSVRVQGNVRGDVVTLLGSVRVDDGKSISGDIATVGGEVSLEDGATVNGDVAVVGGSLNKGQGASVGGDSNVMMGKGWLLLPFAPLLILVGLIWLLVWLISRRRYRPPVYPQGRIF